jgi:hypothetical protein
MEFDQQQDSIVCEEFEFQQKKNICLCGSKNF